MARRYSTEDKRAALTQLDSGADMQSVSAQFGVRPATLRLWQQQNAEARESRLRAEICRLEERLIENTHKLLDGMDGMIENAPLNQRATALGIFIDRYLKLDEHLAHTQNENEAQDETDGTIRIEYRYPDGSIHRAPPWAGDDSGYDGPISRGGLWPSVRQNGDGQNPDSRTRPARRTGVVAGTDLRDGEPSVARFEDDGLDAERLWPDD